MKTLKVKDLQEAKQEAVDKLEKDNSYNYMLLDRLRSDLEYYWNWGHRNENVLYNKDYKKHIRKMINIWKQLPKKPIWLTANELISFKNRIA